MLAAKDIFGLVSRMESPMTAIRHLLLFGIPTALMLSACPEDGEGEQGAAEVVPEAAPEVVPVVEAEALLKERWEPGRNAHDCGGSYRMSQGHRWCTTFRDHYLWGMYGPVTVTVLDLPPKGGSEGEPCITSATFDGPGDFNMNLPAGWPPSILCVGCGFVQLGTKCPCRMPGRPV